jgi:hypothetical protein
VPRGEGKALQDVHDVELHEDGACKNDDGGDPAGNSNFLNLLGRICHKTAATDVRLRRFAAYGGTRSLTRGAAQSAFAASLLRRDK